MRLAFSSPLAIALGYLLLATSPGFATTVSSFAPYTTTPTHGTWIEMDIQGAGTAAVVDLDGVGENLENHQPLARGAARITTGASNDDKAQVGVFDDYGNAGAVLTDTSFALSYDFYKSSTGDLNAWAAPAIRLTISDPAASGDNIGSLVYESYWQNDPLAPPPTDDWVAVAITSTEGLFWWDGGLGEANSFGGPPLRTLSEWAGVFGSSFDDANLVALSLGVGTYNQGQTGYFDDVAISYTGYSASYDFEPIPEPTTALLLALGLAAGASARRRQAL